MKLTAFTDYSLRVLIYLATQADRRATVAQIGTAFDIKLNHLTKVTNHLAHCGWIVTVRGKGGGLTLAHPAAQIRIGDVVRDTEGQLLPVECFEHHTDACVIDSCCRLKGVLAEALAAFHAVLDRYTLADIARNRAALGRLLGIPITAVKGSP